MPETKPGSLESSESAESRAARITREALRDLHRDNNVDLPALAKILDCSEAEAIGKASKIVSETVALIDCLADGSSPSDSSETEPIELLPGISTKSSTHSRLGELLLTVMGALKSKEAISELFGLLVTPVRRLGKHLVAKGYLTPEQLERFLESDDEPFDDRTGSVS